MKKNRRVSITKQPRRYDVEVWKAWDEAMMLMLEEAKEANRRALRRMWENQLMAEVHALMLCSFLLGMLIKP